MEKFSVSLSWSFFDAEV